MEELSNAIGTTRQAVYKYENDIVTNIPYDKVLQIAKTLNVDPWAILGWKSPSSQVFKPSSWSFEIPFINQKLSAGPGSDYLSPEDISIKRIDILESLARGVDKSTLIAAEVEGDSMIGEKIYSGDIAIFSKGLIKGPGIYVINYGGDILVKKIIFDAAEQTVTIISANPDYPPKTVDADVVGVLGKVIGWIHVENY